MKDDLISRRAAIDAVEKESQVDGAYGYMDTKSIVDLLSDLPSAEPERPKSKWIPHREKSREYIGTALVNIEYDYWFCDTCGYRVENGQPIYNFCPHCGANMISERGERWIKNSLKKDEKY